LANTSLLLHKLPVCDWRSPLVGGVSTHYFWSSVPLAAEKIKGRHLFTSGKRKTKEITE
jgi:hypothetical protein